MLDYIYISIFVSFPEALVTLLMGFSLSNIVKVSFLKLLAISAIQAGISFLVMMLNLGSGYASLIQITSLYLLVLMYFQFPYYKAIVPVLIGSFSQGALQSIILPLLDRLSYIEITALQNNFRDAIVCFFPILLISVLLWLLIRNKNYYICDIGN